MGNYSLSYAAEFDLEKLLEYGIDNYGQVAAIAYYDGLVERFEAIAQSPLQYPAIDDIRLGYRMSVYKEHSIYFRGDDCSTQIVRILNGQDIEKALRDASLI